MSEPHSQQTKLPQTFTPPNDLSGYEKHYSDTKLTKKIKRIASHIGLNVLYPVALLYTLLKSNTLSLKEKSTIIGALGYFILPIDIISDLIIGLGYADDIAVMLVAINIVSNHITPQVEQKTLDQLHQWLGNFDNNQIVFDPKKLKTFASILRLVRQKR